MKAMTDIGVALVAWTATVSMGWALGGPAAWDGGPALLPVLAVLAVAIQLVFYIPAVLLRTEKFYDLVGSLTYVTLVGAGVSLTAEHYSLGPVQWALVVAVVAWAVRLGSFLALRVHRAGKDRRFDTIKSSPTAFLVAWSLQGLWCFVVSSPVLVLLAKDPYSLQLSVLPLLGLSVWAFGFSIEVIADHQKKAFRMNPANQGKWICTGLWSRAQHPNYFGEIVLWSGLVIAGSADYRGMDWLVVLSPVLTAILLTSVSGVPMVREQNRKKWGGDPAYLAYLREVPLLIPSSKPFQPGKAARASSRGGWSPAN